METEQTTQIIEVPIMGSDNTTTINYNGKQVDDANNLLNIGQSELNDDIEQLWAYINGYRSHSGIECCADEFTWRKPPTLYKNESEKSKYLFDEVIYRMAKLSEGEWNYRTELGITVNEINNKILNVNFDNIKKIICDIKEGIETYNASQQENKGAILYTNLFRDGNYENEDDKISAYTMLASNWWNKNADSRENLFKDRLEDFKNRNKEQYEEIEYWDVSTFKEFLASGKDIDSFIKDKKEEIDGDDTNPEDPPYQPAIPDSQTANVDDQFNSSKTVEEANTEPSNTGTTDPGKSDDNSSSDTGKTEPTKDTDTKDSDKTFENKPKPDNPPIISDNKGSSGVSHGGLSSNNGKGNYTFTNSGISASQDEPIEILTDEKPGDDQITSLPDDNEDIYTIPTDLSGVTSTKKHSSGGGSSVIPILGGLGAAAAVGVGAKIYMDNKKNNDNDEDSSESDDNTEDWNEASNENDGILADEWNEDDSNFEFDDSEPNMDDDESGFSEI